MYCYYDSSGFLAHGPSIRDWRRMRAALTGQHGQSFAATGICDNPVALARELDETTDHGLSQLRRAADSARMLLIISDGVR